MSKLRTALADVGAVLRDDSGAATAEYAIATMATVDTIRRMRMDRRAIAARVLIEERWSHATRARGIEWRDLPALVETPVADGGLGYPISIGTIRERHAAYVRRIARARAETFADEQERQVDIAVERVHAADLRLAAAVSDFGAYRMALIRYEAAERALDAAREPRERASFTAEMRDTIEIDLALRCDDALAAYPENERAALRRSLGLDGPLALFERAIRRSAPSRSPERSPVDLDVSPDR